QSGPYSGFLLQAYGGELSNLRSNTRALEKREMEAMAEETLKIADDSGFDANLTENGLCKSTTTQSGRAQKPVLSQTSFSCMKARLLNSRLLGCSRPLESRLAPVLTLLSASGARAFR